uniref:Uncharacterized protein n=1 Tax=Coccolithus braarudii TaxID=221442 RepID=A0A7S0LFT8_9EUKA
MRCSAASDVRRAIKLRRLPNSAAKRVHRDLKCAAEKASERSGHHAAPAALRAACMASSAAAAQQSCSISSAVGLSSGVTAMERRISVASSGPHAVGGGTCPLRR